MKKNNELDFKEFSTLSKEKWKEKVLKDLKGKPYESIIWENENGFKFEPYFTAEEVEVSTGIPGHFPYERGGDANSRQWQICQETFDKDPKNANKKALLALMGGATAVKFHRETQDHNELEILLNDVVIDIISLYLKADEEPLKVAQALTDLAESKSIKTNSLRGSLTYDPLGDYAERGGWIDREWRSKLTELSKFGEEKFSLFHLVDVDSTLFQESGATAVQELAIALSKGNEYLHVLKEEGQDVDTIAAQLQFTLAIDSSYFTELAKFRAFRPLWATVVQAHEPKHDCSTYSYLFGRTSQRNFAVPDAYNNLLRSTTEAMSAALGGVNALSILPFDHLFDEENPFSMRMSRNIQNILAEESFLNEVADPAGGSYYIEQLTEEIKKQAWKLFQEIEKAGGYMSALENGTIQNMLNSSREKFLNDIDKEEKIFLGVNKYFNENDESRKPGKWEEKEVVNDFEPVKRILPGMEISTESDNA